MSLDEELRAFFGGRQDAVRNVYGLYARLREESPVHRFGAQTVLVARHRDATLVYRDPRRFPQPDERVAPFDGRFALLSDADLQRYREIADFERLFLSRQNGDRHRRYRAALQRGFSPRRVAELRARVQAIVDEVLEPPPEDWMTAAYRVPLLVIMELLGAPREDAEDVKRWGDGINEHTQHTPIPPELIRSAHRALAEYRAYAGELVGRNRRERRRTSLVALLLDAGHDDRLSEDELVATFMHLLFAGHETTTNLLGNGLLALLTNRDQWRLLCADARLVPGAVEEALRYDSPSQFRRRLAAEDVDIGGVRVPAGTSVMLLDGSANRDPQVFVDADRFDVTRRPNDHHSLGHGAHFCLGAPLARLEGRIVFETVSRRFPGLELAADPDTLTWSHRPGLRGLVSLPVTGGSSCVHGARLKSGTVFPTFMVPD